VFGYEALTQTHIQHHTDNNFRNDVEINELDRNIVYDRTLWRILIHVANPT